MTNRPALPPGQRLRQSFDRFGLGLFANRVVDKNTAPSLRIRGDLKQELTVTDQLQSLDRVDQLSDFHCVTTWSVVGLKWSGYRFRDFYHNIVVPQCLPDSDSHFVVFRSYDGYAVSMSLHDLLRDNVLLADNVDGNPLGIEHGGPLRLVAPDHYGYKSAKHLESIEFWRDSRYYRFPFPYPNLMDHPRGRVEYEERAKWLPNWLVRPLYRVLQAPARRKHARAVKAYKGSKT